MDKRTFLKTSTALLAGTFLAPLAGCTRVEPEALPARKNWAGNLTYSAERLHMPRTVEEVQEIVSYSHRVRPLGSRHSFNTIADSADAQLSLEALPQTVTFADGSVTVPGGMRYGELVPYLDTHELALHNLASLPHISVAGALATATHGSGVTCGNLATPVIRVELVTASGELVALSREADGDRFAGAVVGLGSLGVVTHVTLALEPAYQVMQHVYLNVPLDAMAAQFDEIMSQGYSVSIFTDWQTQESSQIWIKRRVREELDEAVAVLFGATLADRNVHPVLALSAEACTEQMGQVGIWHSRLPHFKMEFTPSSGEELQSEFFVDRRHAPDVIGVLRGMAGQLNPLLMISEVRTIAADDLWMSTAYGRDSVAFHFTWHQDWEALQALLPELETRLALYEARPHWGKNFNIAPEVLQSRYPKFANFRDLAAEFDPDGKFRNAFTERYIFE